LKPRGVLFSSNPRGNNEEGLSDDRYACFFDLDTWRDYVTSADFEEVGHYYRPPGPPKLWPMTEGALAQLGSGNHGADFLGAKLRVVVRSPGAVAHAGQINRRDAKVAGEVRRNVAPPVAMCTAAMNEKKPALALGGRSVMGLGPALGYRAVPLSELNPKLNAETAVIVMLETAEGIENCEAIAAVDGLDVLLIGSGDLTTDLGIPGQVNHPRLRAAYERWQLPARRTRRCWESAVFATTPCCKAS
jgi:hypothetical protein